MATYFNEDAAQQAMLNGLNSHLKAALREQFEKAAKEVINEAVAAAMKTFETSVKSYIQPDRFERTIQVILNDRRDRT